MSDEKVTVKTYVPESQKAIWVEQAEKLDMSQAEFIRCMVQAGRRTFENGGEPASETVTAEINESKSAHTQHPADLAETVLAIVREYGPVGKEEILAHFEDSIADILGELLEQEEISWDPHGDGYVLVRE